jgi:hypothetical protein
VNRKAIVTVSRPASGLYVYGDSTPVGFFTPSIVKGNLVLTPIESTDRKPYSVGFDERGRLNMGNGILNRWGISIEEFGPASTELSSDGNTIIVKLPRPEDRRAPIRRKYKGRDHPQTDPAETPHQRLGRLIRELNQVMRENAFPDVRYRIKGFVLPDQKEMEVDFEAFELKATRTVIEEL